MSLEEKRGLVCPSYKKMSVYRQCKVMELPRSSYYFKPKGESLFNLQVMNAIDRKFLDCPFYGVERMTDYLRQDLGYFVGYKRVRRLYKLMNLKTIHPKKPHATDTEIYLIERVKKLRLERGISQAQLAYLLDVSTGFIGHVESSKDRAKYNLNMLVKLKAILDCEYSDLLP